MAWSPPPRDARKPVYVGSGSEFKDDDDVLFYRTAVNAEDLEDASDFPVEYMYTVTGKMRRKAGASRPKLGVTVDVNGRSLALFKYLGTVLAVDAKCPHMGELHGWFVPLLCCEIATRLWLCVCVCPSLCVCVCVCVCVIALFPSLRAHL